MLRLARLLGQDEAASSAVEYAILVGFIAVIVIAAVAALGTVTSTHFEAAKDLFK